MFPCLCSTALCLKDLSEAMEGARSARSTSQRIGTHPTGGGDSEETSIRAFGSFFFLHSPRDMTMRTDYSCHQKAHPTTGGIPAATAREVQGAERSGVPSAERQDATARRRARSLALGAANVQPCTRGRKREEERSVHVGGAVVRWCRGAVVGPLVLVLNFLEKLKATGFASTRMAARLESLFTICRRWTAAPPRACSHARASIAALDARAGAMRVAPSVRARGQPPRFHEPSSRRASYRRRG